MAKACLQCGDEGFIKELVYCTVCTKFAVHQYCMNVMPDDDHTADALGNKFTYSSFGHGDVAEPLIRLVWSGSFDTCSVVDGSIYAPMEGFSPYLSTKSCPKVHRDALHFNSGLQLEMVPKFRCGLRVSGNQGRGTMTSHSTSSPSLMKFEEAYGYLVYETIRDDMVLKGFVENAELMIFTSLELPPRFQRFQGRLYLWGSVPYRFI